MMHFPSVSDFPPVSEEFSQSVENSPNFTFSRNFFRFSSAEISDDLIFFSFFSHQPQILNVPLFSLFQYIPPYFDKIILSPPTFTNSPLFFGKFTCFYMLYVFFVPPAFIMMHLCITQCTYWTPLEAVVCMNCSRLHFFSFCI